MKLCELNPDDTFKFYDSDTPYIVISSFPEKIIIRHVHGGKELDIEKNGNLSKFFSVEIEVLNLAANASSLKL